MAARAPVSSTGFAAGPGIRFIGARRAAKEFDMTSTTARRVLATALGALALATAAVPAQAHGGYGYGYHGGYHGGYHHGGY